MSLLRHNLFGTFFQLYFGFISLKSQNKEISSLDRFVLLRHDDLIELSRMMASSILRVSVLCPMKKLYVSQSLIDVESRKELLDQEEIPCTIKNQRSAMLGGEVPFVEVFPELWVLQDEDFEKAQTLLQDWENAKPVETTSWTCGSCGEVHQKEFTTCWKCNQERT